MKFLSVIENMDRAAGGPVECVFQLKQNLESLGHSVHVLTVANPEKHGGQARTSPERLVDFSKRLRAAMDGRYDVMLLHGIWTIPTTGARLLWNGRQRYGVFPHGMLDPYFINNFPLKHLKKSAFYRTVAAPVLSRAEAVLFTCDEERRLASISYKPVVGNRVVIRYGTSEPDFNPADYRGPLQPVIESLHDKQKLLFLGRIHPKKGCDLLIEAAKRLTSRYPSLHFVMAGPDETHWAGELKKLAKQYRIEDHFTWLGPVYGREKWFLYSATDAMILPSHMENFGMTVGEALAVGQPVLLSDKVNIFPSIVRANAGFVDSDTVEGTASVVTRWLETPEAQRRVMKQSARALYEREFRSIHAAQDLLKVFRGANN